MPHQLTVSVLKDGDPFLAGTFDVSDVDYPLIAPLLAELDMTEGQAASILSGFMHAREVGNVTEEMGKIAMIAVVYMLEAGKTVIEIPLEAGSR